MSYKNDTEANKETLNEEVKHLNSWDDLTCKKEVLRGIFAYGFETPSPIQKKGIIPLIEGRDIISNLGNNVNSQVFNDHAANYCYIESNNIQKDRDYFIKTINSHIEDPRFLTMKRKIPR